MKQNYQTIFNIVAACLVLGLLVGACAGGKLADNRTEQEKRQAEMGKLFGDELLVFGKKNDKQDDTRTNIVIGSAGIGVSSYLWFASMKVVDFMPLLVADRGSGIILTDWYQNPNHSNERFKVDIRILSQSLRSDGVRVNVFQQELKGDVWFDQFVPKDIARSVEDSILNEARVLRASSE